MFQLNTRQQHISKGDITSINKNEKSLEKVKFAWCLHGNKAETKQLNFCKSV